MEQVREDFDRIALLTADEADARKPYSNFLLKQVPSDCDRLLEIGCGFGAFTRLLANRAKHVTAIDLSPQMIRVARDSSKDHSNVDFILGDFFQLELPTDSFDCIVSIATLHHLPQAEALNRMKAVLRPGGALIIHDLLDPDGLFDKALDFIRLPISLAKRFWQTGRPRPRREARMAWKAHEQHDTYLKAKDVRAMRDEHLPGGNVEIHFMWRYTVLWCKHDTGSA
jgi:ubiquinone/menaquinone biosynthesis C-methylase UbiE